MTLEFRHRLRWACGHFFVSALILITIGALIFFVWYPSPFRALSGGLGLFLLVACVDMVLGPVCTFAVASTKKRIQELRLDVALIAFVQLAALSYGLWTVYQARPVYLAFEVDRLRVVHAVDVDPGLLEKSAPEFQTLPRLGPQLVAVRPFQSAAEKMEVTVAALQGVDIGARPDLWTSYESQEQRIRSAASPVESLLAKHPSARTAVEKALTSAGLPVAEARYLPVAGRQLFWIAVLSPKDARPLLYLPLDPYQR